jgi:UDP-GlcNAc3NAcA epimerase
MNLGVGSGSPAEQTSKMLVGIECATEKVHPDLLLVYGDTNSTLAGALVASKLNIPLVHIEAGLRSYDRQMPEEVNRVVTDRLSALLFCPTRKARGNLAREGIKEGVFVVGDVMYDLLCSYLPRVKQIGLDQWGVTDQQYYLATVHRAGNADDPKRLFRLLEGFGRLKLPVVFPVHPRTRKAIEALGGIPFAKNIHFVSPVGYLEMLALQSRAKAVLTDSGGVQKEAYWLRVPCVTLREETEWVETLVGGWNVLAGSEPALIAKAAQRPCPKEGPRKVFGNGHAAETIVRVMQSFMER